MCMFGYKKPTLNQRNVQIACNVEDKKAHLFSRHLPQKKGDLAYLLNLYYSGAEESFICQIHF